MAMYCPVCNEPCQETIATCCGSICPECLKVHVTECEICAEDFDESEGENVDIETKKDQSPRNTELRRRRITQTQWLEEGTRRFGPKGRDWKFKCVSCGNIQTGHDFLAVGFTIEEIPKYVFFSCIGRWTKEKGCDWTLGGLLQIHTLEVIDDDGKIVPVFEFAD